MRQVLKNLQKFPKTNILFLLVLVVLFISTSLYKFPSLISLPFLSTKKADPIISPDSFDFSQSLEEAGTPEDSKSKNWWVNSGAYLVKEDTVLKTVQAELPVADKWAKLYKQTTPVETDNGLHPQNIFRLVNKSTILNFRQQAYFKINKTILSRSPNRNESNGLLFFNRYNDGDNLYYTGIRVDGIAIVKKKKNGVYTTMSQTKFFDGSYNKESNPNLLPQNQWLGLRSEVQNTPSQQVLIKLFLDREANGNWHQIAEVTDDNSNFDGAAFTNPAHVGIRTDFMDVEFKDYSLTQL